ncbi:MAG: hypothetical protein HRT87_06650 [Legionellales bacterium]|nr:hypothetical protein [Legionellales bacterium]
MSNFIGDMKELFKQQGSTFDRVYVDVDAVESIDKLCIEVRELNNKDGELWQVY